MANYGLYTNINTTSLKKEASYLKSLLQQSEKDLLDYRDNINTISWKCSSKEVLINSYSKIDTDLIIKILKKLDNIENIAKYVDIYKSNEAAAKNNKSKLQTPNLSSSSISNLNKAIYEQESQMTKCESAINDLIGG